MESYEEEPRFEAVKDGLVPRDTQPDTRNQKPET
jgi:hypothetical protein